MALTPDQIQKMDQISGMGGQQSSSAQATNPVFNAVRTLSGGAQNIGLGEIPEVAGAGYELGRTGAQALGNKQAFQPNSDPFLTDQQLGQYSNPVTAAQQGIQNIAGAEAWGIGGLNPLGMSKEALLTRGLIGGASGIGMNVSQGRGADLKSNLASGLAGAGANMLIPPLLEKATGSMAKLSMGATAGALPQIARETGQTITGLRSAGARAAQANIGQKIGNLYDAMGTGMTKNDIFGMLDDTPKLTQQGGTMVPTSLDYFMKENGISAAEKPQVLSFLKQMALGPKLRSNMSARGAQATSGTIEKEMNAEMQRYLADNPDIAQQVATQGLENTSLPGGFWHDLATTIRPSQKVFDAIKKNPDYEMSLEDKIRMGLSDTIRSGLQTKLAKESPHAIPRLQELNKMYGAITPIAKGTAQTLIPRHMQMMAPLALGYTAYTGLSGQKSSPYFQLLGALAALMNPQLAGSMASKAAVPATNAVVNALSGLGASKLVNRKQ